MILFAMIIFHSSLAFSARIVLSCGSVGQELELCRSGALNWSRKSHHEVEVIESPANSNERIAQYQLLLAAKSKDIDIFLIDTTWPGLLSDFLVDLKAYPNVVKVIQDYFPSFIENNTIGGKLLAIPWFIDAGVLYYRSDLLSQYGLPLPKTWRQLGEASKTIQEGERSRGNYRFWGYVFQGRAYEGLTCNALEWLNSYGGGRIVDSTGSITVNNPYAIAALSLIHSWIGGISPLGVLNYMEEEARGIFQSGNAAFMRNWPYAWKLVNSEESLIRGKVGMDLLPQGEGPLAHSAATLGGWSLAVSKYSKNPDIAVSLVLELGSFQEQKRRALVAGLNPAITKLYRDPELLKANPMLSRLFNAFTRAVARPSDITRRRYNQVSAEFWNSVHSILKNTESADQSLAKLEKNLNRISRRGKW
jgi:trehalose/maltose transport system substrate-binding protein